VRFEFKYGAFQWVLPTIFVPCGESRLLVSWCVGDRCDMTNNDEDLDRSRKPDTEDRGWSCTGQVLDGRMIRRSGDTVCGLYCTHGDEKRGFLG
jgi:hypothetical protein